MCVDQKETLCTILITRNLFQPGLTSLYDLWPGLRVQVSHSSRCLGAVLKTTWIHPEIQTQVVETFSTRSYLSSSNTHLLIISKLCVILTMMNLNYRGNIIMRSGKKRNGNNFNYIKEILIQRLPHKKTPLLISLKWFNLNYKARRNTLPPFSWSYVPPEMLVHEALQQTPTSFQTLNSKGCFICQLRMMSDSKIIFTYLKWLISYRH